jgi:hypothetical protein
MMEMDDARSKKIKKGRQTSLALQGPYGWFFHFMDLLGYPGPPAWPLFLHYFGFFIINFY